MISQVGTVGLLALIVIISAVIFVIRSVMKGGAKWKRKLRSKLKRAK